jgi:hypothetical protein
VAERRIAEQTGRGIVCFISNHSWLRYPSFVVMRERLANEFDRIWIDNLNGSKFETGKVTPDGSPDPSAFSTESNHEGIQVGTAIALLAKRGDDKGHIVLHRDLWGVAKREHLSSNLDKSDFDHQYETVSPAAENRFSFRPQEVSAAYDTWTALPEIAGLEPFSGVLEKRRGALLSFDRAELAERMKRYFDPNVPFDELKASGIGPVENWYRPGREYDRIRRIRGSSPAVTC